MLCVSFICAQEILNYTLLHTYYLNLYLDHHYLAYILTWMLIKQFEKANKISSIIGIIGIFNLPVIKYSVDWWNTLHQPSSITLTSAPTIHYSMLIPLVIMFFGMIIYSLIIFLMKYKTEIIKLKINKRKNLE